MKYPSIYSHKTDLLLEKINNLVLLGYSFEQVFKMVFNAPIVLGYATDTLKKKISDLESLGYKKNKHN